MLISLGKDNYVRSENIKSIRVLGPTISSMAPTPTTYGPRVVVDILIGRNDYVTACIPCATLEEARSKASDIAGRANFNSVKSPQLPILS